MTVTALARLSGFSSDAVRYYERVGLLPPPPRTSAGYRHYGADALDRLLFIQGAQRLGLRLREIRELLGVRDSGACPCGDAAVLLRQRKAEVDTEIERLSQLQATLQQMVSQLPSPNCPDPVPGVWKPPAYADA
ncbi:heavy metal-responsive transcriptional regulator [Dactylosporangium sp. CA-092794]|uniref:heavy metal-responsive transcriptional regulator n=1 Tax=Dactylosporangium sp. CA-092794 TaxID=3239929 RepID=UPI003D8EF759